MSILKSTQSGGSAPLTIERLHSYGFVFYKMPGMILTPEEAEREDYFQAIPEEHTLFEQNYLIEAKKVNGKLCFTYRVNVNKKDDGIDGNILEFVVSNIMEFEKVHKYFRLMDEEKSSDKILTLSKWHARQDIFNTLTLLRYMRQQNKSAVSWFSVYSPIRAL